MAHPADGPARGRRRGQAGGGPPREDALAAGLRYLAGRARSESEIRLRLRSRGHEAAAIDAALERLRSMGYVDDRAMAARLVARGAAEKPAGKARLTRDLRRAGIAEETIDAALRESWGADQEAGALAAALESLARREKDAGPQVCRRLAGALMRRGFAPGAVFDAVRKWSRGRQAGEGDGEHGDDWE